jgi:hypothetical protein
MSKTPKVRLRFMFHYRSFPERRLVPLPPSAGPEATKAQPQGCNKSSTFADEGSLHLTVREGEGKCGELLDSAG